MISEQKYLKSYLSNQKLPSIQNIRIKQKGNESKDYLVVDNVVEEKSLPK